MRWRRGRAMMGRRFGLRRRVERGTIHLGALRCYHRMKTCKAMPKTLETSSRAVKLQGGQSTMPLHPAIYLVLCRRSRVLQSPLPSPNLCCHYTCKESYSQDHRLTAKADSGSSSRDPLELEINHAEATSRPVKC